WCDGPSGDASVPAPNRHRRFGREYWRSRRRGNNHRADRHRRSLRRRTDRRRDAQRIGFVAACLASLRTCLPGDVGRADGSALGLAGGPVIARLISIVALIYALGFVLFAFTLG